MLLYRATTDGQRIDCTQQLRDAYGAVGQSACWIVGAGPSLLEVSAEVRLKVERSAAGRIACNYAGRGRDGEGWILKPNLWTTYDPTPSFPRSTFMDPSITKFLKRGKEMDLVPGTMDKICDCPATFFISTSHVSYTDFFPEKGINDSRDTFIQALGIAVSLGYRKLYLLGTELRVSPSTAQLRFAQSLGVEYPVAAENRRSDSLDHFITAVAMAMGVDKPEATEKLESLDRERQYAFDEQKPLRTAALTDWHYWERVQYLRLAKKNLFQRGISIISATPNSRLNDVFPYRTVESCLDEITAAVGSPTEEHTSGKYTKRTKYEHPWHRDVKPYEWKDEKPVRPPATEKVVNPITPREPSKELAEMKNTKVVG